VVVVCFQAFNASFQFWPPVPFKMNTEAGFISIDDDSFSLSKDEQLVFFRIPKEVEKIKSFLSFVFLRSVVLFDR
jgi:hypothetical protein